MSNNPAKRLRAIGKQLISKSQNLNELAKILPDESRKMAQPEISEGFTEAEIKSIHSMTSFINKELAATEGAGS